MASASLLVLMLAMLVLHSAKVAYCDARIGTATVCLQGNVPWSGTICGNFPHLEEDNEALAFIQVKTNAWRHGANSDAASNEAPSSEESSVDDDVISLVQDEDIQVDVVPKLRHSSFHWPFHHWDGYVLFAIAVFIVVGALWFSWLKCLSHRCPEKNHSAEKTLKGFLDRSRQQFVAGPPAASEDGLGKLQATTHTDNPELPTICSQLLASNTVMQLLIPAERLSLPSFTIDVLAHSDMPVLSVSLAKGWVGRRLQIRLYGLDSLLVVITPARQLLRADGTHIGTLVANGSDKYKLRDKAGHEILHLHSRGEKQEINMVTVAGDSTKECALVVSQTIKADNASITNYQLAAKPGVDSVLMLACFLALVVFSP